MITFEDILPTLNELFIEKLPICIEEINKIHNDGLIICPFENKTILENCQKLPCFKFELLEAEYIEKDRIIENTVFKFSLEIKTKIGCDSNIMEIIRYTEAMEVMIRNEKLTFPKIQILKVLKNYVLLKTVL